MSTTIGDHAGAGPVRLPLVVGVTGHRDIVPASVPALRERVRALLAALRDRAGCPVEVASGLAGGADLLVAEVAAELGLRLVAVVPMPMAAYRSLLVQDGVAEAFDRLLALDGTRLIELPELGRGDQAQYEQLGAVLARRCHVLLALWDGQDEWEGADAATRDAMRGGAGHVVHMARTGQQAVPGVVASPLFAEVPLRRAAEPQGMVLQVASPREKNGGALSARGRAVAAGACVPLWGEAAGPVEPGSLWAALDTRFRAALGEMQALNAMLSGFDRAETRRFQRQMGSLLLQGVRLGDGGADALSALGRAQAGVDTAAQVNQRRLLGVWVPAAGVRDMWVRAWRHMRVQGSWFPPVGVLFLFALAVPAAVLAFELYAHALHSSVALVLYALALMGGLGAYHGLVKPQNWQNRFQDHRALAEALRVQLFLALAGVPVAVPDHYLRRPAGELGWIRLALQGPALWALGLALGVAAPQREAVRRGWFEAQRTYFIGPEGRGGMMKLHGDAAAGGERRARQCVGAAIAFAFLLCVNEVVMQVLACGGTAAPASCAVLDHWVREWLLVAAATAPAMAAFFVISVEKRAYEAHAHAYGMMGRLFEQALRDTAAADDAEFRAVTLETAREALAENADWLLDHRRRRIDYTPGA